MPSPFPSPRLIACVGVLCCLATGGLPGAEEKRLPKADTPVEAKLGNRSAEGRGAAVRYGGATAQSEAAVERGLRWLVVHQRDDGSWHFDHRTDACMSYCTQPGSEASTTAATAMALLPMLGAGYTHRQGEYQDLVQRGLDYLRTRGVTTSYGFDLRDGSMYGHALATIALCEAYAMTQDPVLHAPAQGALRFIEYVQDAKGGGWRYNPGEPGDTTVTGWMLMALKSGQMAKLQVATPAIFQAERFLSSVQNEDGSMYGYMTRKPRKSTSAEALLCRMYTGWRRDRPELQKGVAHLAEWGPAKDDIYYDYYATQVMFHYAGPQWDGWNRKMREWLIAAQDRAGHAAGSWYIEPGRTDTVGRISAAAGGRLYSTSMAVLILEVYYRHMPLYSQAAVSGGF
ncbi:MAG: prenyltransferase/squalene oxidase repeat-containing protein [Thermoguttaceae bacterium]|jgi:squalene cyclase